MTELIDDLDRVLLIDTILAQLQRAPLSVGRKRLMPLLEKLQGVDTKLFVERPDP